MRTLRYIFILFVLGTIFSSCKNEIDSPAPSHGDADFTRYVALGSSFTSGYTDGALYTEGQQNSFPSMLAKVFSEAGGGTFKQPLVNDDNGIGLDYYNTKLVLTYGILCDGTMGYLMPYAASSANQSILNTSVASQGPFNNLGVPGMLSGEFNDQFFVNRFYARFASNPGGSSLLSEATALDPTFFTLVIGIEDIFSFAKRGGEDLPDDTITSLANFSANVDDVISKLVSGGAKGAITNVPDVSDFAFFNKIRYDGLVLSAAEAQNLNSIFSAINTSIVFKEGNNPYIVEDATSLPSGLRQLKEGELVLFNIPSNDLCNGYGSVNNSNMPWAFEDKHVLDLAELSYIRQNIFNYNSKLETTASQNDLAFINLYDFFKRLSQGIIVNGVNFNSEFITGKAFSLDGLQPNPQGYALIANEFIRAINDKYGASLHEVDPNSYPGIKLP